MVYPFEKRPKITFDTRLSSYHGIVYTIQKVLVLQAHASSNHKQGPLVPEPLAFSWFFRANASFASLFNTNGQSITYNQAQDIIKITYIEIGRIKSHGTIEKPKELSHVQ